MGDQMNDAEKEEARVLAEEIRGIVLKSRFRAILHLVLEGESSASTATFSELGAENTITVLKGALDKLIQEGAYVEIDSRVRINQRYFGFINQDKSKGEK